MLLSILPQANHIVHITSGMSVASVVKQPGLPMIGRGTCDIYL